MGQTIAPIRTPYPSEDAYFRANPHVAGMAAEDNAVILNPYSNLSPQQKEAVVANERARIQMRTSGNRPSFAITPQQAERFRGYGSEQDVRETLVGRFVSGDTSAGQLTPEQQAWVGQNFQATRPNNTGGGKMAEYTPMPHYRSDLMNASPLLSGMTSAAMTVQDRDPTLPVDDVGRRMAVKAAAERLKALSVKTKEAEKAAEEAKAAKVKARNAMLLAERDARTQQSRYAVFDGNRGHFDKDTQSDADRRERTNVPLASGYTWPEFGQAGRDNINASFKREQTAKLASLKKRAPQSQNIVPLTWEQGLRAAVEQELGPGVDESLIIEAMQGRSQNWKAYQDLANTEKELLSVGETPAQRAVWTSGYRSDRTHTGFAAEKAGGGTKERKDRLESLRIEKEERRKKLQENMARFRDDYSQRKQGQTLSARDAQRAGLNAMQSAFGRFQGGNPGVADAGLVLGPEGMKNHPDNVAALARATAISNLGQGGQPVTPDLINAALAGMGGSPMPAALITPDLRNLRDIANAANKAAQKELDEGNQDAINHRIRMANMPTSESAVYQNPALDKYTKDTVRDLVGVRNFTGASTLLRGKVPDYTLDVLMREWTGNQTADRDDASRAFPWEGNVNTAMNPDLATWKRYYLLPGAGWEIIKQRFGL